MPLEGNHENDIGLTIDEGLVCIYDIKDDKIKNPEEIFEGGVQFFLTSVADGNRNLAERITRKNMNSLPYWQNHPFTNLQGPKATDQEFIDAMKKL